MTPEDEPPINPYVKQAQDSLSLAFSLLAQVGVLTVVVLVGSLAGGLALDKWLDTRPIFTVLLMLGSFPISMYIIYRVAIQTVAKIPPPPVKSQSRKEVADSDDA